MDNVVLLMLLSSPDDLSSCIWILSVVLFAGQDWIKAESRNRRTNQDKTSRQNSRWQQSQTRTKHHQNTIEVQQPLDVNIRRGNCILLAVEANNCVWLSKRLPGNLSIISSTFNSLTVVVVIRHRRQLSSDFLGRFLDFEGNSNWLIICLASVSSSWTAIIDQPRATPPLNVVLTVIMSVRRMRGSFRGSLLRRYGSAESRSGKVVVRHHTWIYKRGEWRIAYGESIFSFQNHRSKHEHEKSAPNEKDKQKGQC